VCPRKLEKKIITIIIFKANAIVITASDIVACH
jgi:hypothetical protein